MLTLMYALPLPQTDRSRGFGFVTMKDIEGAEAVIKSLNGIVSISQHWKYCPYMLAF